MTKAELINTLVEDTELSKKDCESFLNSFMAQVTNSLKAGNDIFLDILLNRSERTSISFPFSKLI